MIQRRPMHKRTSLPTLLLVTSDPIKVQFFKKSCIISHYIIHTPYGVKAKDCLHSMDVDIIILDVQTLDEPLMDFCRDLRQEPLMGKTSILLITNNIQKAFITSALNAGASDFLREPLDEQELYARLAVAKNAGLVSQKMSLITSKISTSPLMPQNTNLYLHRMLLSDDNVTEIARAKKFDTPLSILMIELDQFIILTEKWGELTVDEISAFIADFLEKKLRQFDTILPQGRARYLLMLPKTSPRAANAIAEDLRKEISIISIPTKNQDLAITVSIGIVSFDKKLSDVEDAYEQFNRSLQNVKKCLERAQKQGNTIISDD